MCKQVEENRVTSYLTSFLTILIHIINLIKNPHQLCSVGFIKLVQKCNLKKREKRASKRRKIEENTTTILLLATWYSALSRLATIESLKLPKSFEVVLLPFFMFIEYLIAKFFLKHMIIRLSLNLSFFLRFSRCSRLNATSLLTGANNLAFKSSLLLLYLLLLSIDIVVVKESRILVQISLNSSLLSTIESNLARNAIRSLSLNTMDLSLSLSSLSSFNVCFAFLGTTNRANFSSS